MKGKMIYEGLMGELRASLDKRVISEKLIDYLMKAKDQFILFEDESMKEKDILYSLKLFSASNTCNVILENSIPKLREAKSRNENPTALERLYDILSVTIDLGNRLSNIFDGKGSREFELKDIRKISLTLQEEAEKRGLIESLDEKIMKTPKEIRKSIIQKLVSA